MLTVLLSILSKFPVFANVGEVLQGYIIENFVPASGEAVHTALQEFVANTGKMSAVGGGFLFIAALMLISNIDKNLTTSGESKTSAVWCSHFRCIGWY